MQGREQGRLEGATVRQSDFELSRKIRSLPCLTSARWPCLCPFPCLSCSFGSMAKWGEGDPRWIVEERPDSTNVNNWHWYAAQHGMNGLERAGEPTRAYGALAQGPHVRAATSATALAHGPRVRPSPTVLACPTRPRFSRAPLAHGALARGTLLAYGPHVRPSPAFLACPTRPWFSRAPLSLTLAHACSSARRAHQDGEELLPVGGPVPAGRARRRPRRRRRRTRRERQGGHQHRGRRHPRQPQGQGVQPLRPHDHARLGR